MSAFAIVPESAESPDAALLAALAAGDPLAFEELVRAHAGRMLAVARRMLPCEDDAHDALQDAFISALRGLQAFRGGSSLGTWLHRIVVNACLMKLRSRERKNTVSIEELLPTFDDTGHHEVAVSPWSATAVEQTALLETRQQIREAIERLPETHRSVLLLRDIEELDTEATAALLGISTTAVKTRLHRARQALRALLTPAFGEEP